jgi:hypothetical protein
MPSRIDDRWLWFGFGAVLLFAVRGIRHAIPDLIRLTKIDPYQYEPNNKKEERPEDCENTPRL